MTGRPFWQLMADVGRQKLGLRQQGIEPRAVAAECETLTGVRQCGRRLYVDGAEQAFGLALELDDDLEPGRLEVRP